MAESTRLAQISRIDVSHELCRPHYDRDRRELRVGQVVVRRFDREAWNQIEVLKRFEAVGWPQLIADPLGKIADATYAQQLKNVVFHLNHRQKPWLIVFHCRPIDRAIAWRLNIPLSET
jgi:hypothetical protein